jgi:hypothetical protein
MNSHFDTEGPFGVPMKDAQARALKTRLKDLPKDDAFAFRRCTLARGLAEWQPEGRADVSWITEEAPDRVGDIVRADGMDDSHFALNPLVTLNHNYAEPPVGRSLWRKRVKEGSLVGIKAKTHYPARPGDWAAGAWPPDVAFDLLQSGLLLGKSIGFLPLKVREPNAEERRSGNSARLVVEQWLLLEYACCFLPMQPNSVVEQVLKAARSRAADPVPPSTEAIARSLAIFAGRRDFDELVEKSVREALQRARYMW